MNTLKLITILLLVIVTTSSAWAFDTGRYSGDLEISSMEQYRDSICVLGASNQQLDFRLKKQRNSKNYQLIFQDGKKLKAKLTKSGNLVARDKVRSSGKIVQSLALRLAKTNKPDLMRANYKLINFDSSELQACGEIFQGHVVRHTFQTM